MSGFWPAWNQPSNTRSSSAVDFSEYRSSTMTRSCFMETSGLIAVTISVSRERRSASSFTANANCSRAVKPSPLPASSLRHFLSRGVNHSAAASRGPISMRACRYSSASRSASRSSAGRTWAMVPVISIGPFRGVRTPKSASTRPMPASHASGQEQCHALQAHGPGPRSARRWRRVCRAAPSEAFSPQSAGVTRRPQPNVNVAMVVAWHADMEKSRRLSPGPSV